ncbi:MAG: transglutaminase-like domain-containing protein [Deltaproteobacteria bacterium]|nr:transglutaminase-like domain-containing protein [Deltaproteobacteria bacterium]
MKSVFKTISLPALATLVSGLIFMTLLAVRMGWFQSVEVWVSAPKGTIPESETWMGIYQKSLKIGMSHRKISPMAEGVAISETTVMRLNTMGMVQDIHLDTQGVLNADFSLASFQAEIKSGLFRFAVSGQVQGASLVLDANGRPFTLSLQSPVYLSAALWDAAGRAALSENQSLTLSMFDPLTMSPQPVKITALGMDRIEIMGAWLEARKVSVEVMGSRQTAWIDTDGSVVQEEGVMGITLKKISAEEAKDSGLAAGEDLTRLVSVPADQVIADAEKLSHLVLRITGVEIISTERQRFDSGILTISREALSGLSENYYTEPAVFLEPAALIQSDHPLILKQLWQIISEKDTPLVRIQNITEWIYLNIEKRPVLSVPNALETLENRMGDCNEHAVLFAAFARAAGIPARIEAGLVHLRGRFYYHAWNSVYLGKWITVDSLMNQIPADVTHISLSRGNPENQLEILGSIGNIGISILEQQ